jgi:hypothetical protein
VNFTKVPVSKRAVRLFQLVENVVNSGVRTADGILGRVHLGGRKADYDDEAYEFVGGAQDEMRAKHYDKSLRLMWKAEEHASWSSFKDCTPQERELLAGATEAMSKEERDQLAKLRLPEFKAMLQREYTPRERQAIVNILSAIGHGEAYAWLVSAELLATVKGTGAKSALAAQVIEEAKHFVVMRELVQAFEADLPRLSAWEYVLLEQVLKAEGLEKFFGMNIIIEGIALNMFGILCNYPGLEILRLFHRDESRHAALPVNYLKEFPMSRWQKGNPLTRLGRMRFVIPALPLVLALEEDMAELGIDAFEFGGSVLRKLAHLADRAGFYLPVPNEVLLSGLNLLFNGYCKVTRPNHRYRDFRRAETTRGAAERRVEHEEVGLAPA